MILRIFLLLIFYTQAAIAISQAVISNRQSGNLPANYYQSANGLTCAQLKTALSGIISAGYNELLYGELWATYSRTDKRRNDANTADIVWDMYSDNPTGPDPYTYSFGINQCGQYNKEGDCYNREHTFPQSWFTELTPMKSDMNHIFPTDGEVNGIRSNFPYGDVTNVSITTRNGSRLGSGNNFGYTGTVFEPINEYKGDVARAILYMAVRYESQIATWLNNGNANEVLNGTTYPVFDPWHIKLLYKWHLQDPVSEKEIRRNDSVFVIQKNRNPFIDRPEWVYDIWSCTGLIVATSVTNDISLKPDAIHIYPQPAKASGIISIECPTLNSPGYLEIVNFSGEIIHKQRVGMNERKISIQRINFKPGLYFVKINKGLNTFVKKLIID